MNPMTNIKNIQKLSNQELNTNNKTSWHDQYKDSAWIFIGGLPYDLTEGDIICIFSQYGEIVNINLIRDKDSGKSKGFCFLCYEDQRSTVLAVDNLNSLKILGRTVRVDHVTNYKAPDETRKNVDDETRRLYMEGCAPVVEKVRVKEEPIDLKPIVVGGVRLPPRLPIGNIKQEDDDIKINKNIKKEKKDKKSKKEKKKSKSKKKSRKSSETSEDSDSSEDDKTRKDKKTKQVKKKNKSKKRSHESSDDSTDSDTENDRKAKSHKKSKAKKTRRSISESPDSDSSNNNKKGKSQSTKKDKSKKRSHKSSSDSEESDSSDYSSNKKRKTK